MKIAICLLITLSTLFVNAADAVSTTEKTPVPTGKYITGGVLGSVLGFGIGHAIQGRYAESGAWKFTAGQSVGLALFLGGLSSCDDKSDCASGALTVGYITMLAFHVWEVVDLWTTARPVSNEPQVMIIPDMENNSAKLAVGLRF